MTITEQRIKAELEAFIDWPTNDRSTVTTASCLLFAKVIAGMVEAELGKDAERYRLFAETIVAESSGIEMTAKQRALWGCMNGVTKVSSDELAAMFDAALNTPDKDDK